MFDVALQLFPSEAWRCALTSASRCVLTSASRCVLTSRHGMAAQGCVLKVCSRLLQPRSRYAQGMLKVVRQGCVPKAPQGMCAKVACSSLLKVCVLKVVCSRFCPHQRLRPQPTRVHAPIKGRRTSAPTPYSAAELSVATYRELQIDWRFRLMHSD